MRRVIAALLVAAICGTSLLSSSAIAAPAAKPAKYEYFLLIDTSGSMMGLGPGNPKKIFPKVQTAVSDFIGSLDLGTSVVYLYPFDSGVGKKASTALNTEADKRKAQKLVMQLKADGSTTAIYDSLGVVLADASRIRKSDPDVSHVQTILLFTDGRDTSKKTSLKEILARYRLERGENPFLFLKYVTLGTTAAGEWKSADGVTVQEYADATDLPALHSVRVRPTSLDFGSLRDADESKRAVEITFDPELEGTTVELEVESEDAETQGALVSISPDTITLKGDKSDSGASVMRTEIALALDNKESLDEAASYLGSLRLASGGTKSLVAFSPPEIPFEFSVSAAAEVEIVSGDRRFGGSLGELDPYADAGAAVIEIPFEAVFNNRAQEAGSYVTVRVRPQDGAADGLVTLSSGEESGNELRLTPESPEGVVSVSVPQDTPQGEYAYNIEFEPSDATIIGLPAEAGVSAVPVSFTVPGRPVPPPPLWKVVLTWLLWILLALVVLAIIAFVVLCVSSGATPGAMLGLLAAKIKPALKDARIELTEPADKAELISATGKPRLEFGSGTGYLEGLPVRMVIEQDARVLEGRERARLRLSGPVDGSVYFSIKAPGDESGLGQPSTSTPIHDEDEIEFIDMDGKRYALKFMSSHYRR